MHWRASQIGETILHATFSHKNIGFVPSSKRTKYKVREPKYKVREPKHKAREPKHKVREPNIK